MTQPITVDIPHQHGRDAIRVRIDGGVARLGQLLPGGAVVDRRWEGDTLHFTLTAMGQRIASRLELFDDRVHATIDLPPMLALFADRIRAKLAKEAPKLLG